VTLSENEDKTRLYSVESILTRLSLVIHPHEKGDIPIEGMPSAKWNKSI
jgi:hypothetical protein